MVNMHICIYISTYLTLDRSMTTPCVRESLYRSMTIHKGMRSIIIFVHNPRINCDSTSE